MAGITLYVGICLLCFSWMGKLGGTIHVKVIPENLNGYHQGGNFSYCDLPCVFSENPKHPDAELYIAMNDEYIKNAIEAKSLSNIKILGSQEPPHYYRLLRFDTLNEHFQGTALLNRASDVPWPLIMDMDDLKKSKMPKNAKSKASYIARNCHPKNNRNDVIQELQKVIDIVAPSTCFHNMEWPQCGDGPCSKIEFLRGYKIYLAFENGDSPGFITDKIYHAYAAGVLPVWLGTRDIEDVVPKHSYINVDDFTWTIDLAIYLAEVLKNETLYNSYFEWKWKPFDEEFVRKNRMIWKVGFPCRLCNYVDTLQRGLRWNHGLQIGESAKGDTQHKRGEQVKIPKKLDTTYLQDDRRENEKCDIFLYQLMCLLFICITIIFMRRKIAKLFSYILHR